MKRFLIALCAVTALASVGMQEAEAKRLGGGGSVGMSRNTAPMQRQATTPPQQAKPASPQATPAGAPAAPAASGMGRFLGPIAGIAAGLGLAALFSHLGMGEGMGNILTIALLAMAAFFIFRMLFRRKQTAPAQGYQFAGAGAPAPARFEPAAVAAGSSAAALAATDDSVPMPAGFDAEGFVRQAKLNFIRLQAANDKGDLEDIKQFTTPEFFAEVKMQFDERGKSVQQTDVVQIDAALVEVAEEDKRYVASVRFHGLLREEANAAPAAFDEVWHLTKPADGSRGWSVAGIQQLA